MQGDKVNIASLTDALAGVGGRNPFQTRSRLARWAAAGIIPPLGKIGRGSRSAWEFDARTAQIAAILFAAFDQAGICDHGRLKGLYAHLAAGEPALIEEIMGDVAAGREPVLVATLWAAPNAPSFTSFAVRLEDERARPIIAPTADHERIADAVLWLAPLLERFTCSNVVPFKAAD